METNKKCTCGQTHVVYYPDENQHEPACWDCWDQQHDEILINPNLTDLLAAEEIMMRERYENDEADRCISLMEDQHDWE